MIKINKIKLWRLCLRYSTSTVEHKDKKSDIDVAKLKENRPFSKDMLLNRFNLEFLEFPEIVNNDGVSKATSVAMDIEKAFQVRGTFDRETLLSRLSTTGIMGVSTPGTVDSDRYSWMMIARLIESLSLDVDYTLINYLPQILVCQTVHHGGNEAQIALYERRLASADLKGCIAITEGHSDMVNDASISATATPNNGNHSWIINGQKTRVFNYGGSDIVVVFAKTPSGEIAPFIVDCKSAGISAEVAPHTANKCCVNLRFTDVAVPMANILSSKMGVQLPRYVSSINNMAIATVCSTIMKSAVRYANDFICSRHVFGKPLSQSEMIQTHMVGLTADSYSTETVAYFSAGLLDTINDGRDWFIESTIAKIHSIEALKRSVDLCFKIIGTTCLTDPHFLKIYDDANKILLSQVPTTQSKLDSTKESLDYLKQQLKLERFSLYHTVGKIVGDYKIDAYLHDGIIVNSFKYNLHPRIGKMADNVYGEYAKLTKILKKMSQCDEFMRDEFCVKHVANVLMDSFVLMAVMGRASRSMSIGLRNFDLEVKLTEYVSKRITRSIKNEVELLGHYPANVSEWNSMVGELKNDLLPLTHVRKEV